MRKNKLAILIPSIALMLIFSFYYFLLYPFVSPLAPAETTATTLEDAVNGYRIQNGLPVMKHDERLCSSAQAKLDDMVNNNYFEHTSPKGVSYSKFIADNTTYRKAGENLATSHQDSASVFSGWINSPSHKANIVDAYDRTCVKVVNVSDALGITKKLIAVQHFAK